MNLFSGQIFGYLCDYESSEKYYRKALNLSEQYYGIKHFNSVSTMDSLALILLKDLNNDFISEKNKIKTDTVLDLLKKGTHHVYFVAFVRFYF